MLYFLNLLSKTLIYWAAWFIGLFYDTIRPLQPADWGAKISRNHNNLLIFDHGDDIGDIFFKAYLLVIGILLEILLLFAMDRFSFTIRGGAWQPDQLKLKIATKT